jgi:hypothetical protein
MIEASDWKGFIFNAARPAAAPRGAYAGSRVADDATKNNAARR